MWSEISIQCKKELPANLSAALEQQFGTSYDKRKAIDATVFRGTYDFINRIVYAYHSNDKVFLIQNPTTSSLKIHIESNIQEHDIRVLRDAIEDSILHIINFLKANKNKINGGKAIIYAEDSYLQTARLISKWKMFKEILKNNIFLKIYIPLATFITSVMSSLN